MDNGSLNKIKLIIADDYEIVRSGLREIFEKCEDIDLVEEADNGEDIIELADFYRPDIVILDFFMPRMNGCEAGEIIKQMHPATKVIILVADDGSDHLLQKIECDCDGLLSKQLLGSSLIDAIYRIADGEKICAVNSTAFVNKYFFDGSVTNYT